MDRGGRRRNPRTAVAEISDVPFPAPYGNLLAAEGPAAAVCNYRFAGGFADAETGLQYHLNRYYDPRSGTWLSRDPIKEAGGANIYAYCINDPISNTDPIGDSAHRPIPQRLVDFPATSDELSWIELPGGVYRPYPYQGQNLTVNEWLWAYKRALNDPSCDWPPRVKAATNPTIKPSEAPIDYAFSYMMERMEDRGARPPEYQWAHEAVTDWLEGRESQTAKWLMAAASGVRMPSLLSNVRTPLPSNGPAASARLRSTLSSAPVAAAQLPIVPTAPAKSAAPQEPAIKNFGKLSTIEGRGAELGQFKPGQSAFACVYSPKTKQWLGEASGEQSTRLLNGSVASQVVNPPLVVKANSGHATVSNHLEAVDVGGDPKLHVAFTLVPNINRTLTINWKSTSVNDSNFNSALAPVRYRQDIIKAVERQTGMTVAQQLEGRN